MSARVGIDPLTNAEKKVVEMLKSVIAIRLSDIWLNKMVFERIFVKTDPVNSEKHANKMLVT